MKGDWTDDTDQMLLILLGVVENKGRVLKQDFAKRMKTWTEEGFAELGDRGKCAVWCNLVTIGYRRLGYRHDNTSYNMS